MRLNQKGFKRALTEDFWILRAGSALHEVAVWEMIGVGSLFDEEGGGLDEDGDDSGFLKRDANVLEVGGWGDVPSHIIMAPRGDARPNACVVSPSHR